MPELLLLCEYATLNGGERSMLSTLDAVCAAGFEPAVMCPPEGPLAAAVGRVTNLPHDDIELIPFSVRGLSQFSPQRKWDCPLPGPQAPSPPRRPLPQLREELAAVLRRRRPALLHANSLSMGRLSGPVAAELAVPSLAHLRDIIRLSGQTVADLNCHRRLLAVSEATRAYHVAAGLDAAKTFVLYNGVDLEQFRPRPATGYLHRELGLPPETPLVGTIGQIGLRKGQDVLVRAAELLAGRFPQIHYLIVGERFSDKAESRAFEAALHVGRVSNSSINVGRVSNLPDNVGQVANLSADERQVGNLLHGRLHFLGFRDDVDRLLNELTLLVHPARQEPLGRVLLEAAASGVPVVATDVGGTREIFPPEADAARLVPPDDPAALAAAITELVPNPGLRRQIAAAARERAVAAFDVCQAAARLVEQYRCVLATP